MKITPNFWHQLPDPEDGMGWVEATLETEVDEIPIPIETNDIKAEEIEEGVPFDFDLCLEGCCDFQVYADEADYDNRRTGGMAAEALFPMGCMGCNGDNEPSPRILISGKVIRTVSEQERADLGYKEDVSLFTISCLGCEFDCIVPGYVEKLPTLEVGNIVRGCYWVEGYKRE